MLRRAFVCTVLATVLAAPACHAFGNSGSNDADAGPALDGGPTVGGDDGPGNAGGDGAVGPAPCADAGAYRLMFVTQALLGADLGGQVGAASVCTAIAADAGLPGSYVAWLSTSLVPPGPNLAPEPKVPILLPDCDQLAADLDHLMTSGIEVALDVTERGLHLPSSECRVWTSTLASGTPAGHGTCAEWTSNEGGTAVIGRCDLGPDGGAPTFWTAAPGDQPCDAVSRLYCLQN